MRTAAIVIAFAAGIAGAASCFVDRRSGEFTCTKDEDCAGLEPARTCDEGAGFCVPGDCPAQCNGGCNQDAKTCTINCLAAGTCDNVHCPGEYTCSINCNAPNACDRVDCGESKACTITCLGANACGNVDCGGPGDPECTVTCNGNNACGDVTCDEAACTVLCIGNGACGDIDCVDSCNCRASCLTGSCGDVTCPAGCTQGMGCGGCNTCST